MTVIVFDEVAAFIRSLPPDDHGRLFAAAERLGMNHPGDLKIKTLRGKIQELVVRRYRLLFFKKADNVYVVMGFKKQSKKTPLRILRKADAIYRIIRDKH